VIAEKPINENFACGLYVRYGVVKLGVCNSVRLVELPCYKYVKSAADRVNRFVWRDCALCKPAIV
jgi:hypothetical protein